MEVRRGEPIAVVEHVLRRLERQAIAAGSHPVLIHEGMQALDRLREENARLRGYMRPDQIEEAETVTKLIKERDEARAVLASETKAQDEALALLHKQVDDAEAEVGRLRAIISPGDAAAFEDHMAAREAHWVAEVSRLEGLILDWDEAWKGYPDAQNADLPLLAEARRIRAQREEGRG